jgi:uncharacterized protein (DUF433 family)
LSRVSLPDSASSSLPDLTTKPHHRLNVAGEPRAFWPALGRATASRYIWGATVARLDMPNETEQRIVMTPGVCGGRPRIRGTRMTVVDLLAGLAAGDKPDDIVADFPEISHEDIAAALRFAADTVSQHAVAAE